MEFVKELCAFKYIFFNEMKQRNKRMVINGDDRDRTDDLHNAIVTLSQLSYIPAFYNTKQLIFFFKLLQVELN